MKTVGIATKSPTRAVQGGRYRVQVLDRALDILDLLAHSDADLGPSELAAKLSLHRSTTHRLLKVLERHHLIRGGRVEGKYGLGIKLFELGNRVISRFDLGTRSQVVLRRLVEATGETAHVCVLNDAEMVSVANMEDMATAEIRVSILWEWLHKGAPVSDPATPDAAPVPFTEALFEQLVAEEYSKLVSANNRDVHEDSKRTTLPVAKELAQAFVCSARKLPWFVNLLNATLSVHDVVEARKRVESLRHAFLTDGVRVTKNLDFDREGRACST